MSKLETSPQPCGNVVDLAAWRVRVRGSASHGGRQAQGGVAAVRDDGMVLSDVDEAGLGRFVWLDVELPNHETIKALGEVVARKDPRRLALDVKFKHLFPDQRHLLTAALGR